MSLKPLIEQLSPSQQLALSKALGFSQGVLAQLSVAPTSPQYATDEELLAAQQLAEGQWTAQAFNYAGYTNNPFNVSVAPSSKGVAGSQPISGYPIFSTEPEGEAQTALFMKQSFPKLVQALEQTNPEKAAEAYIPALDQGTAGDWATATQYPATVEGYYESLSGTKLPASVLANTKPSTGPGGGTSLPGFGGFLQGLDTMLNPAHGGSGGWLAKLLNLGSPDLLPKALGLGSSATNPAAWLTVLETWVVRLAFALPGVIAMLMAAAAGLLGSGLAGQAGKVVEALPAGKALHAAVR
ncbi:MAG: hypothetical protein M0005_10410 [Actinomycetota bacterium]|jgi:hypothetical protein|nr:hypothetical protein [Actinomycetota bacterium]